MRWGRWSGTRHAFSSIISRCPRPAPGDVFARAERTSSRSSKRRRHPRLHPGDPAPPSRHYLGESRGRTRDPGPRRRDHRRLLRRGRPQGVRGHRDRGSPRARRGIALFPRHGRRSRAVGPVEDVDAELTVRSRSAAPSRTRWPARSGGRSGVYSLSGRFEALLLVAHTVAGQAEVSAQATQSEMSPTRTTPDTDDISSAAGNESPEE